MSFVINCRDRRQIVYTIQIYLGQHIFMKKSLLSIVSVAAVLLFVGAGCTEAQTLETNNEIQENNSQKQEQIEVNEEAKTEVKSELKIEDNQKTSETIVENSLPKANVNQNKEQGENENENENESEDENEDNDDNSPTAPTNNSPSVTTPAPVVTPKPTNPTPAPAVKTYTLAEVQAANSNTKCWSVISGNVYNLTPFTPGHPGGQAAILGLCGKDGTAAFKAQHGGQAKPENTLAKYFLGALK